MSRKKAVAGGIGVLATALATSVLLAPSAGATATSGEGVNSAYAIAAKGLLGIDPSPYVTDEDGFAQESLAKLDVGPLAQVHVLNASAGAGQARASVADVKVGLGAGKPLLTASAIESECEGGKGTSSLAKAKLGDVTLDVKAPTNTTVAVPGLASVVLNKQVKHDDGSITVTAISIKVDNIQTLDIASVTCAPGDDDNGGGGETPTTKPTTPSTSKSSTPTSTKTSSGGGAGSGAGDKPDANGKAPRPTPVKAHLDVTG
ncbi:choice-of-anchor P family protein [Amycolatopsis thermophila]|uniref:Membrane protein n=1 Tax=Amycolatopsis thermophila TaxID=206084 RepID=A0ABU0ETV9_9PSEU|nr:choice-of-anchor P family protein [Amycolatopsis thermophila]MDQ0378703.1 putative membrane protein [Amycolatopsis thermophila]